MLLRSVGYQGQFPVEHNTKDNIRQHLNDTFKGTGPDSQLQRGETLAGTPERPVKPRHRPQTYWSLTSIPSESGEMSASHFWGKRSPLRRRERGEKIV